MISVVVLKGVDELILLDDTVAVTIELSEGLLKLYFVLVRN
jgi:hypothetical protein